MDYTHINTKKRVRSTKSQYSLTGLTLTIRDGTKNSNHTKNELLPID